jgi:hypothetical protein
MATRPRDFDRWVILTLHHGQGRLLIDYQDETGVLLPASADEPSASQLVELAHGAYPAPATFVGADAWNAMTGLFRIVVLHAELATRLLDGVADMNEVRGHWTPESQGILTVPWLLPIFVRPPAGLEALPWETWLEPVLLNQMPLPDRYVLVRLHQSRTSAWPAPPLPLTIASRSRRTDDMLQHVRQRSWYANNEAVREYGLRLLTSDELRSEGVQVQVLIEDEAERATRSSRRGHGSRLPDLRLSIRADDQTPGQTWLVPTLARSDASTLVLRTGLTPAVHSEVFELVYALVHDFALHEIVWILRQRFLAPIAWLATDPPGTNGLRLSRAMRSAIDDILAIDVAHNEPDEAIDWLRRLHEQARSLAADFTRESRGLTYVAEVAQQSASRPESRISFGFGPDRPLLTEVRQASRERRLDVVIERHNDFGVLEPMDEFMRREPLRPGWPYRLSVRIGAQDGRFTAMVGEVPPIDPLLPPIRDDEAWELDVAVFEKSFKLLSAGQQRIRLPRFGGSQPVHFEVRAPATVGPSDLRLALYLGNNQLQSFVLEAQVGPWSSNQGRPGGPVVLVRLASSGLGNFDRLDAFGERAFSVALNDDLARGTHTLMIKQDGVRRSIALSEKQVDAQMTRFRDLLEKTTSDEAPPFDETVRNLAQIGSRMWLELVRSWGRDTSALRALRTDPPRTLQFVRHGGMPPFPWQTVYDYDLPRGEAFRTARICVADTPIVRELQEGEKGCRHSPGQDVICIEGFWSVRHRIEQISEDLQQLDGQPPSVGVERKDRITVPSPNPLVGFGLGVSSGATADTLKRLRAAFGKELHEFTSDDAPVESALWQPNRRPGVLVLLSHLEPGQDQLNLPARLRAYDSDETGAGISAATLLHLKSQNDAWSGAPLPLVLLMACGSARTELGELTSLVDAFFGLGAVAVAGTECDIRASQAGAFTEHLLTSALIDHQPLGEALRTYHRAALQLREPFPFVFTVYGSADLTIHREAVPA